MLTARSIIAPLCVFFAAMATPAQPRDSLVVNTCDVSGLSAAVRVLPGTVLGSMAAKPLMARHLICMQ